MPNPLERRWIELLIDKPAGWERNARLGDEPEGRSW